jgi:polyhydroxybutyrate depolymerase
LVRTYRIVLPDAYDSELPLALVLALHGGGGNADQMCELKGGLPDLLDEERFLLVCPDGIEEHWNDGRQVERYRTHREGIDDVGFLLKLVDQIVDDFNIMPGQVYVTGASNGGLMSYRLACEASDRIAAAAAVIANLPAGHECEPKQPISIMVLNGTDDPLMPYAGGQVRFFDQELGEVISTAETVAFWVEVNGCTDSTAKLEILDEDPRDETQIIREEYLECAEGVEVVSYEVVNGGHTWPGGSQYAPRFVIGTVSRDAHAGELIWEFFRGKVLR